MNDLREWVASYNDEALLADGLEDAFIGMCSNYLTEPVAAYDVNKCIQIFVERDNMTLEEAQEWFDYNVVRAYMGKYTPMFLLQYEI